MTYKGLNSNWKAYAGDHSDYNLNQLLASVRRRVIQRYIGLDRDYEDIAQIVMIRVWRALPGYTGTDPLKTFDPLRGDMAAYVTQVTQAVRKNMHRHDRLVCVTDDYLEQLQHNAQIKEITATDPIAFEDGL